VTSGPGAGTYNLPSMLLSKKDHNKAPATSAFHQPIAKTMEKPGNPAPNIYDVCSSHFSIYLGISTSQSNQISFLFICAS